MGTTFLGDIQSGAIYGAAISHASAATDGAAATIGAIGALNWRAPQDIVIVDAWWEPTGADQNAADAASYRVKSLIDAGAAGLGTRVLGSRQDLASIGSNTQVAFTLISAPTVAKGNVVAAVYSATTGGTHAGTVVRAGNFRFTYRPI